MDASSDEEQDKINDPSCALNVRVHLARIPENLRNDRKELGNTSMAEMRDRSRSPIHRDRTPSPLFNSPSVPNDFEDGLHDEEKKYEVQMNENEEEFPGEESQLQQLIESSFINESNNSEITNMEAQNFSHDTASTTGNNIIDGNELSEFQNDFYENLLEQEPPEDDEDFDDDDEDFLDDEELLEDDEDYENNEELLEDDEDFLNEGNQPPLPSQNLTSSEAKKKSTNPIFHYLPARILESDEIRKDESKETCPICREELKDLDMLRLLPCSHEFHAECVDDWIIRKKKCPLCRATLNKALLY